MTFLQSPLLLLHPGIPSRFPPPATPFSLLASRFSSLLLLGILCLFTAATPTTAAPRITAPKDILGFNLGDDYQVANYTQISSLLKKWQTESKRIRVVSIGLTEEGREQYMAIITSPANHKQLERFRRISQTLSRAEISDPEARKLAKEGKCVVWIDGGLHATESVNSQSLAELAYQLVSRDDEETKKILDDTIALLPIANPDGVEMAANWYMRDPDVKKRSFLGLPRLYHKYAGHDNNRDSIAMNLRETINQNRILYIEWNPPIMLNVHQSSPAGSIVFIPPFRDPYNYNYDPLIPLGIAQVGAALHSRLVSKGLGGSVARSTAPYSTWANGGIRHATYFRNQIGLLTEIFGNPTPTEVPLIAERQLASGDGPLPVRPGLWHYRQSIDYQIEIEKGLLLYASLNRELLLNNIYTMGRNSIERGSRDSWTITPRRIEALKAAAKAAAANAPDEGSRNPNDEKAQEKESAMSSSKKGLPVALYEKVLHDPAFRDPRGYIISSVQEDFPTAVKFVNTLLKGGVVVHKAKAPFEVAGKTYPSGSYIVKTAQAFRPAVLDSFEPLDHPSDLEYPGGPPKKPYDIAGWTLAAQMGVQFDRLLEDFTGPFEKLSFDLEPPPQALIGGPAKPAGYLISHRLNDSFIVGNRLLKAGAELYWLRNEEVVDGLSYAPGTLWVPATEKALAIIQSAARDLGVPALGRAEKPAGEAIRLRSLRIALVDVYGGSMPSGWTRFLLDKFEFPYEVIYPPSIDAGDLSSKYDVVLVPSGLYSEKIDRSDEPKQPKPSSIPEEYRARLGKVTLEKSGPALKTFIEQGGTVVALGTSAWLGKALGLPLTDYLAEKDAKGKEQHLPSSKFYIPGSVLNASFDPKTPLGFGLYEKGYVFFQDSPTFRRPDDLSVPAHKVVWFGEETPLYSGWALGQEYLRGGEVATTAGIGKGQLALIGLEASFRAASHANFKLLFNGLFLGLTEAPPTLTTATQQH